MKKTKDQLFWEFSLKHYSEPEVEQNLLYLQNHYGFNVNMVLFCCWYGVEGLGRLSQKRLHTIDDDIKLWHERIIKPLRRLRKTMKEYQEGNDDVLRTELVAEKAEQKMIVSHVVYTRHRVKSPIVKLADICKSLCNCCRIRAICLNDEGVDSFVTILSKIFHMISLDEAANIVTEHLFESNGMGGTVGTQMWLEL